jgi:hypothetical protein
MNEEINIKSATFFTALWQCGLAVIFMAIVLFMLGHVAIHNSGIWAIGAGSLAASTYMVFVTPHQPPARFFQLFCSYLICILIGLIGHSILTNIHSFLWSDLITAFAVGLALFIMSSLRLRHSCAAGVSVMLVLELQNYYPVLIIFISVLLLGLLHTCFKSKMKDLV